jgi:hypothetical protein
LFRIRPACIVKFAEVRQFTAFVTRVSCSLGRAGLIRGIFIEVSLRRVHSGGWMIQTGIPFVAEYATKASNLFSSVVVAACVVKKHDEAELRTP